MKKQFKNLNELYNFSGYFWNYGICLLHLRVVKTNKKPYLYNNTTKEKITGLANINRYLKINDLEIEEV